MKKAMRLSFHSRFFLITAVECHCCLHAYCRTIFFLLFAVLNAPTFLRLTLQNKIKQMNSLKIKIRLVSMETRYVSSFMKKGDGVGGNDL